MQIRELIDKLEEKYPFELQEEWDNSGLQIGNPNDELRGVVLSLDLEEGAIDKALEESKANLIITHHPYLFNPTKSIDFRDGFYNRLQRCIKNDITVFAFHTNLDIAEGGVNDNLAKILGIRDIKSLEDGKDLGLGRFGYINKQPAYQFLKEVKEKLEASGIVVYGNYDKIIEKVGICGGAGSFLIEDAINQHCDLIVTGDVKYHEAMDLSNKGIIIADVGHFASENHIIYKLQREIEEIISKEVYTFSKTDKFRNFI
ncbi:Nif3-like dinuclear metal center hexameric protein [Anaerococcus degeneri]|uniref:GTP cyclohydrolase 1 type 2 homolog n=1 Tax=Anaerococcus degeneri TaxID=361500 RepID=A0ABS7Z1I2_9FIRM|nr:Nif3-like dinuclear metal center hexameric protein [Anaerococcus degeneri]MBP2014884.1 dinuclear metal center YbgI/SA1388 family protein [Anaerococcus degeneri]MCA2097093.1 Nif3-like dinuclear metal center hexameric protein [Anaerococcus degeneri]